MDKPAKPFPGFPLFPHATGRWAKKIHGQLHYFGPWRDPWGALARYQEQAADLHAGRSPRNEASGLEVSGVVNAFVSAKRRRLEAGEIAAVTYRDYYAAGNRLTRLLGSRQVASLTPSDFEQLRAKLAKGRSPVSLGNEIARIRIIFKYAFDSELIDRPVRMGPEFRPPSRRVIRRTRQANGPKMFEARQIRRILKAAGSPMRAMVLLGINCGWGNTDVASAPASAFDLQNGWVSFPRPKTGAPRKCPLWPGTIEAIREAGRARPRPHNPADAALLFLTRTGRRWARTRERPLSQAFRRFLVDLGLYRRGLGFYCLRRTFATIAGETLDQVAVDYLMGHLPDSNDMPALYRQRISDSRLLVVVEHVHRWLFRVQPEQWARRGESFH